MEVSSEERGQQELAAAYAEYRRAMAAWRAAARVETSPLAETAADHVLQARVRLYRALVDTGWGAPAAVVAQLERDAALVAAPAEFEELLTD